MGKQADLFFEGAGDAFYERNRAKPRLPDPVLDAMEKCNLQPKSVLEIGCGNGWRLAEISKRFPGCAVSGYDASEQAVKEKVCESVYHFTALVALRGLRTAHFDTVIFGFCLYLVDREDLMMIAAHTDRVLKEGGHIVIHDFWHEPKELAYKCAYKHKENVWSYHMDNTKIFTAYPVYKEIHWKSDSDGNAVYVLRKSYADAFPIERAY